MSRSKEDIALKFGLCKCDEAYTKRDLTAPDCPLHACAVEEAMDEYAKDFCLDLLEYLAKNKVICMSDEKGAYFLTRGQSLTKEQIFENFL